MGRGRMFANDPQPSIWQSVLKLVGHLLAAAAIFVVFFVIVWLVSFALYGLNNIHPFPPEIFSMITRVEVYVTYADWLLCIIVLLAGAWRFCVDIWRGET